MQFLLHQGKYTCRVFILTIAFIFVTVYISLAQTSAFTPATDNTELLTSFISRSEQQYKKELESLTGENKKDISDLYKLRWDNIKEKFDTKEIYSSAKAQEYLNEIVAEIVKANPTLQKQSFNCYFSRSGIPNATYIGEGIILFNMGLFEKLDNESQAAFVLCHELSHFYLNHSENSIRKYVNTLNSKEVQQALKRIKNSEFKKREELEKLVKGITFNSRKHSRDHEAEADSMAIEFMRNTKFNLRESLTTLALLDTIDTDTLKTDLCLKRMFDSKEYPFKNKWIAKEEGLLGSHAQLNEDESLADSLKTHPDCKLRIKILESLVTKYQSANTLKDLLDKTKFIELQNVFRYEIIEYAFTRNDYDKSLYYTLQLLQQHPSDPYLVTQVGRIMNGFYNAQKNHTLNKLASLPSPYYPSNYNLLLQFIQNLYKEDYASISYHFLNQYTPQLSDYAPFKKEYETSIQIAQQ